MQYKAECACKRVSIELSEEPEMVFACHCDYCQRLTGSVGLTAAIYPQESVLAIQGSFVEFDPELEKWPGCKRYFCGHCGTTLHWVNPEPFPGKRMVSLGCFPELTVSELDIAVNTKYRPEWCEPFKAKCEFEGFPEDG